MQIRRKQCIVLLAGLMCCLSLRLPAFAEEAQAPAPEALAVLESMQEQTGQEEQTKQTEKSAAREFSWQDLWLDLPADAVLATRNGEPLIYAEEFNQRVGPIYSQDLFHARQSALRGVIELKLLAEVAKDRGLTDDPSVIRKVSSAKADTKIAELEKNYIAEVSDAQAQQYYKKHIEEFKTTDPGTKVLLVARSERKEAEAVLKQIQQGEPVEKFALSAKPVAGRLLPPAVQEAVFHLEPGQTSGVISTPIGFYIAKLNERNPFDQFKVSLITKNSLEQCQEVLNKLKAGEKFENLVADKESMAVAISDLPREIREIVPDMELGEVSSPITTPLGYFIVRLEEHRSNAGITTAKLIALNSKEAGQEILSILNQGFAIPSISEREVSGKDLPEELREVAATLKEGQYSQPVKTRLGGYYLVKVVKRARQLYKPFESVKDEVKKLVRAEAIPDKDALGYYNYYRSRYRKPEPDYIADVILAESPEQGEKILADLQKTPSGKERDAMLAKHRKDLTAVSAELLPTACRKAVKGLKPEELSPVVVTPAGWFILRLNKKVEPAYTGFEDVKSEIKGILAEYDGHRYERIAKIVLSQAEEAALADAFFDASIIQDADKVPDEEAEDWWEENKKSYFYLGIPELRGDTLQLGTPQEAIKFKKTNMLLARHKALIDSLYSKNGVVIDEELLKR